MYGHLKQRGEKKNANALVNIKLRLPLLLCLKGKKMPIPVKSTTREEYSMQLTTIITSLCLKLACAKHPWIEGIFEQYMFITRCSIK